MPAKTSAYSVETVAEGLNGRLLLPLPSRRPHHRRRAAGPHQDRRRRTARSRSRSKGCRPICGRAARACSRCCPDRAFAANRTLYLTYTVLPEGANAGGAAAQPRHPDGREREALRRRQAARGLESAAERRRHRRARDSGDRRHAASSPQPIPPVWASTRWTGRSRSSSTATWARCCGSTPTGRFPRTIRSSAAPARIPRSTRSVSEILRAWRFTRAPASCGRASTGREAATRSTPSRRARTTASRSSATAASTPASRSTATRQSKPEWNSRSISGRQTLRRPASASTPGSCFRHGRAICSWPSWPARYLVRLVLNGERVVGEERLLTELNARIRGVNEGPDGALYVMTDGPMGKIVKLVPRK